jgi:hypothetical protein
MTSHVLRALDELGREPSRREETDYGEVRINPSKGYLRALTRKVPESEHEHHGLSLIRDEHKNHYAWDVFNATHPQMTKALGLSGKLDYGVASYHKIKDWDHDLNDAMSSEGYSTVHADHTGEVTHLVSPGPNRDRKFMVDLE